MLPVSGISLLKSLGPGRDFRNLVNYNYDETLSRACRYLSMPEFDSADLGGRP